MQHATRDLAACRLRAREIPLLRVLENRQFWQISRTRRPISRARKIMSPIVLSNRSTWKSNSNSNLTWCQFSNSLHKCFCFLKPQCWPHFWRWFKMVTEEAPVVGSSFLSCSMAKTSADQMLQMSFATFSMIIDNRFHFWTTWQWGRQLQHWQHLRKLLETKTKILLKRSRWRRMKHHDYQHHLLERRPELCMTENPKTTALGQGIIWYRRHSERYSMVFRNMRYEKS